MAPVTVALVCAAVWGLWEGIAGERSGAGSASSATDKRALLSSPAFRQFVTRAKLDAFPSLPSCSSCPRSAGTEGGREEATLLFAGTNETHFAFVIKLSRITDEHARTDMQTHAQTCRR